MRKQRPLDFLLPKTRQGILSATLIQPGKSWYASELARKLGVPSSSLQRELQDLTEARILKTHRQGRMAYYQANVDSPLFPELQRLFLKTVGLVDVLIDALKPLASKLSVVFIYGSIASGHEQQDSDIDLMVIGSSSPLELAKPLRHAHDLLSRAINPTVYAPAEFEKKQKNRDPFLAAVLDKPKLFVIGNQDELGELAGRTKRHR